MLSTKHFNYCVSSVKLSNVTVEVDTKHSWVSIQDHLGHQVFLQGDEADEFNDNVDKVWNELGTVTKEDCQLYFSYDYLTMLHEDQS